MSRLFYWWKLVNWLDWHPKLSKYEQPSSVYLFYEILNSNIQKEFEMIDINNLTQRKQKIFTLHWIFVPNLFNNRWTHLCHFSCSASSREAFIRVTWWLLSYHSFDVSHHLYSLHLWQIFVLIVFETKYIRIFYWGFSKKLVHKGSLKWWTI